ncbi:hypothetical protein HY612_00710 [Candidatus Roizmanbacteria bacterium]|nr:hypothetical protein [Candidatus Roizmanbacteria bacterium]
MIGLQMESRPKPPEGECSVGDLIKSSVPKGYRQLTYVIHPSTVEGDKERVVQKQIQILVDAQSTDSRVIVIAPPQECVYLKPGTRVTDIRSDVSYHNWALQQDYPDHVQNVTLMGGNLERCLGAVFQNMRGDISLLVESDILKRSELDVTLPLNAIYTLSGLPADLVLNRLLREAKPIEAIVALFTTSVPYQGYYGEFEVISTYGVGRYEIVLDGKPIGILTPKKEDPAEIKPVGKTSQAEITWTPIVLPARPDITYKLNLTTSGQKVSPSKTIVENLARKLRHAREVVFPKYEVAA